MQANPTSCGCGCDERPRPGNVFVHGHNARRSPAAYLTDRASGCWIWQRSTWRNGRPRMKVAGKWVQAYRVYYEQVKGPIPNGLTLDHLCKQPLCVNPAHLEPVTLRENQRRANLIKLTEGTAALIRESEESVAVLAARYAVGESAIRAVQTGKTWRTAHRPPTKTDRIAQSSLGRAK